MSYFIVLLLGVFAGAFCSYFLLERRRQHLADQHSSLTQRSESIQDELQRLGSKRAASEADLSRARAAIQEYESRAVTYEELLCENRVLRRELQNTTIMATKLQIDRDSQRAEHEALREQCDAVGGRYLKDTEKWVSAALTPNNFPAQKKRMLDAIERCRSIGCSISAAQAAELIRNLQEDFEKVVRAANEREEQARIKAKIREEQQREKEIERQLQQLERERQAIDAALRQALADANNQHSAEVARLEAQLQDAIARSDRAVSQAQLTKAGHVYVISNLGSFGDGVFKIGMTRRLEPYDRIKELGDASVPFAFDVHMMISANDAPSLEHALHRALHRHRVNKVNMRKEYFRTDLEAICSIVRANHGEVEYVVDAEALEYRQTLTMTDEDQEYLEALYENVSGGKEAGADED